MSGFLSLLFFLISRTGRSWEIACSGEITGEGRRSETPYLGGGGCRGGIWGFDEAGMGEIGAVEGRRIREKRKKKCILLHASKIPSCAP